MLTSFTGRDDTDDFFAIVVLSVRVNNEQHGVSLSFDMNGSNRVPSLLATLVDPVRISQTSLIVKDQSRVFE